MKLTSKFKCRYCGEVFDTKGRTKQEGRAEVTFMKSILTEEEFEHLLRQTVHFAQDWEENPHMGFADFIGFEVTDKEVD